MFTMFNNLTNEIKTKTELVLMLEDPIDSGQFVKELCFTAEGQMTVEIGEMFSVPARALDLPADELDANVKDVSILPWTVTSMEATANSPLGQVTVTNVGERRTVGTVRQKADGSPFPAILEAEVCMQATVPGFGPLHTITPVPIRAEIQAIPPFGVEAAHRNSGILVDANFKPRGLVVGKGITLVGPA